MSTLNRPGLVGSNSAKISAHHLERLAYVYIRQSSPKQVAQHLESQQLQYRLVQRAEALGWPGERVKVIDADQGLSGQGSAYRSGFQELVGEVSLGHVGIILGIEVSRLARNNSDWYQLLDLAALLDTLIADNDGVYNLRLYNDRLLLGLKGTMSEAELHLLRQRLEAGRLNQVYRGAYRQNLPTGLVRLEDGTVVKDPDEQVRHAIELVLASFERLGSCGKVLRYLRDQQVLLPRQQRAGLYKGQLLWKLPTDAAIYDILRNPAYAGAFVYGRKQADPTRQIPGRRATGRPAQPMDHWLHIQQDVYPAYISWAQYLANQERLHQNGRRLAELIARARGPVREGVALLQGLVVCGQCGHAMTVDYKRQHHYLCQARAKQVGQASCLWVTGPLLDEAVVQAFFKALAPAQLDVLDGVLAEQQTEHQRLTRQWEERLTRAQYDSRLAERHYRAVDPDNRLVAAELERQWEAALRQVQETREAYDRFLRTPIPSPLSPEVRSQLEHIAEALPTVWPSLANDQKKALLRTLITQVICRRQAPGRLDVGIVWVSGHYSPLQVWLPISRQQDLADGEALVARLEHLWQSGLTDAQIAAQLTTEGFHSARQPGISPLVVQKIRLAHGWHLALARSRHACELDGYLTIRGLAAQLGVAREWVYNRLRTGTIPATYVSRHPQNRVYLIRPDPALLAQLQTLVAMASS